MNIIANTLNFLIFLSLFACQMKSKEDSGSIIAGHKKGTNTFTVSGPADGTYTEDDEISFTISHPSILTVTGVPQITIDIGGVSRVVDLTSGDGTKNLVFTYTIVAGDNDSDGIELVSFDINGATITFVSNSLPVNADTSTVSPQTFDNVLIDNTAPTVSSLELSNIAPFLRLGDEINFIVTFSEDVVVTGSPELAVTFESGAAIATYHSGSGTNQLNFRFTITDTSYNYTAPYSIAAGGLTLNSGTIQDEKEIDAVLTLPALTGTNSTTVDFDGRVPFVTSVLPPANATYAAAQHMDITLLFNRAVTVTGSPRMLMTIGATPKNVVYLSGSGTNTLIFRYTTIPGDVDTNGVEYAPTIVQFGGDIVGTSAPAQSFFNSGGLNNVLSIPSTIGVLVGAAQPQVTAVSINQDLVSPVDNYFIIGEEMLIQVDFNVPMYVDQTNGTPRLVINLDNASQVYANYYSGGDGQSTLIFRYVVQEGDQEESGGVNLSASIDLNGGVITDAALTNAIVTLPTTLFNTRFIDGIRPTISNVTPPANGTYSTITTGGKNNVSFTFTFNEAVTISSTVSMPVSVGAATPNGSYVSGSGTANLIFRYTPTAGHTDTDGIALTGTLTTSGGGGFTDLHGNAANVFTYTAPVTPGILVDTTAPTIVSTTLPANGTYLIGQNMDFVVQLSEVVDVNVSGAYPRLRITMNSSTVYASYLSGTGTNTITFRYTVASGNNDPDGITGLRIETSAGGYLRDTGWNVLANNSTISGVTTGILVDARSPTISNVAIPANGTYYTGDTLSFTITYDEAVNVTVATPYISVTADTGAIQFDYVSGTGTTALVFSHTVAGDTLDLSGLALGSTNIQLNGATMADANGNNAAVAIGAQNISRVFLSYTGLRLWADVSDTNNRSTSGAILNSLTDKSGNGNTLTTGGSPTITGTELTFDGIDDTLNSGGSINNIQYVILVTRTPSILGNQDLLQLSGTPVISLIDDGISLDLDHTAESVSYSMNNGAFSGFSTTHDANFSTNTKMSLNFNFAGTPSGSFQLGNTQFTGRFSEALIFDSTATLTAQRLSNIQSYLSSKHGL